jgi:hypothetical protein
MDTFDVGHGESLKACQVCFRRYVVAGLTSVKV